MTEEERAAAVLENLRRRDELHRDIQILEQKLKLCGTAMERFGRALRHNPADVPQSVREHVFELHFDELRRALVELREAREDLFYVNAALSPMMSS